MALKALLETRTQDTRRGTKQMPGNSETVGRRSAPSSSMPELSARAAGACALRTNKSHRIPVHCCTSGASRLILAKDRANRKLRAGTVYREAAHKGS